LNDPLVSIILVNYNGKEFLNECLTSLLNQSYHTFEIILVDNNSSDDSLDLVIKNFPVVHVIRSNTNLGFAAGCNIGVKAANGDMICLFNQDAIADGEWLSTLVAVLQSSENIAAVAGKVLYWGNRYGENRVFCTWPKIDPYTAGAYNFYKGDEPMSNVDYLTGAAMLVKKDVIANVGLLDEGYFLYFDETEWCARMIRASYDLVYVPQAVVWHVVSS
jgi:GT2 family glycosyltransferase